MTFPAFTAAANRRIEKTATTLGLPLIKSRSVNHAEWESGERRVTIHPVDGDLVRLRFYTNGAQERELHGWLCERTHAVELAAAVLAFFQGRGVPAE